MKAKLGVQHLRLPCSIGCYPWEKERKRIIDVDITVGYDITRAAETDALEDAIDYDKLVGLASGLTEANHYHLVEKLAVDVLREIFNRFQVESVHVCVRKPGAVDGADWTVVEVEESRPVVMT